MKRSKVAKLILMGSGPFMLVGCNNPSPLPDTYSTLEQCLQTKKYSEEVCKTSYEEAKARYEKDAPRFENTAACEKSFGSGNCTAVSNSDGTSWFLPALTGYMIANALNSNRKRDREYEYGGGYWGGYGGYGRNSSSPHYGDGAPYSSSKKYDTPNKATTQSRGGFGSISAARGSWGS